MIDEDTSRLLNQRGEREEKVLEYIMLRSKIIILILIVACSCAVQLPLVADE